MPDHCARDDCPNHGTELSRLPTAEARAELDRRCRAEQQRQGDVASWCVRCQCLATMDREEGDHG